jgi:hypothetical protein
MKGLWLLILCMLLILRVYNYIIYIRIIFSVPNTKSDNVDDETENQMYSILSE